MPTVPYANTFRVVCHQSFFGEESTNVWHIMGTTGDPLEQADATAIIGAFFTFYTALSTAAAPNRGIDDLRMELADLDRITVYDLRTVPNPVPFIGSSTNLGTAPASGVPLDVAAVASLRTAVAGRSGRGRIYLGPVGGIITAPLVGQAPQFSTNARAAIVNGVVDLNDRLQALAAPGPFNLAVLSVSDGLSRPVTAVNVDGRPDTQRRRDLSAAYSSSFATVA